MFKLRLFSFLLLIVLLVVGCGPIPDCTSDALKPGQSCRTTDANGKQVIITFHSADAESNSFNFTTHTEGESPQHYFDRNPMVNDTEDDGLFIDFYWENGQDPAINVVEIPTSTP